MEERNDTKMYCPLLSSALIPYSCDGEKCALYVCVVRSKDARQSVHGCALKVGTVVVVEASLSK